MNINDINLQDHSKTHFKIILINGNVIRKARVQKIHPNDKIFTYKMKNTKFWIDPVDIKSIEIE